MITKIGLICGEILELLEQRQGMVTLVDVQHELRQPHELMMMSLGWLLGKGQVSVLEAPFTGNYRNSETNHTPKDEAVMFDLIVAAELAHECHGRVKDLSGHINSVAGKILTLLEGCGSLTSLKTIQNDINEHRDIVLMGIGWLIREGYVKGIIGTHETFLFRLPKEVATTEFLCFI